MAKNNRTPIVDDERSLHHTYFTYDTRAAESVEAAAFPVQRLGLVPPALAADAQEPKKTPGNNPLQSSRKSVNGS